MSRRVFIATAVVALCLLSVAACAWPFSGPIKDIQVVSVTNVDLRDQPQIDWMGNGPRPSEILTRIDFTTTTDLLALARKKEFNVSYAIGPCNKGGVEGIEAPYSGVFWGAARITPYIRDIPGYEAEAAKGRVMAYQIYVKIPPSEANKQLCFTLAGGNMLGGKLRSNAAVIPNTPVTQ